MDTSIITTLIATGSAICGALFKMAYDAVVERSRKKKEYQDRFIEERKLIYDDFLKCNKEHFAYRKRLQQVTLIARAGRQIKQEAMENFPDSPLPNLVEALEKMRRVARTQEMVRIAERIVRLHGDAAAALRHYLQDDSLSYGLPLFLADRIGEDQTLEFISAYRRDLHIGPPEGASKDFPVIDRGLPMPLVEAEKALRTHLQFSQPAHSTDEPLTTPKPLTSKDAKLLDSFKYREIMTESEG